MRSPIALRGVLLSVLLAGAGGLLLLAAGCRASAFTPPGTPAVELRPPGGPPPALREFRGMWVATCENLDWPYNGGEITTQQQSEIDQIIERAEDLKLNALILQIRSTGNAIYDSQGREPWAGLLTGTRGQKPYPYYDPLKMWIDKCHQHGLELHAWIVPFVAWTDPITATSPPVPTTVPYADGVYYDPGNTATQDYVIDVATNVVQNYDVDAMHIDHFFYPYATQSAPIEFPDDQSYASYTQNGGGLGRKEWRHKNIDDFVKGLHDGIKSKKSRVKFGISPFGIPSPNMPPFAQGFDAYECTFADAPKWLQQEWCDYLVPELYWKTGAPQQPFLGLLQWWADQVHNPHGRHIYAGICASNVDWSPTSWSPDEIAGQIMISRFVPGVSGQVLFSTRALIENRQGLADLLANGVYADAALVPATPWLGNQPPPPPLTLSAEHISPAEVQAAMPKRVVVKTPQQERGKPVATQPFVPLAPKPAKEIERQRRLGGYRITWKAARSKIAVRVWALYSKHGKKWTMQVVPGHLTQAIVRDDATAGPASKIAISAVDRLGNESRRTMLDIKTMHQE